MQVLGNTLKQVYKIGKANLLVHFQLPQLFFLMLAQRRLIPLVSLRDKTKFLFPTHAYMGSFPFEMINWLQIPHYLFVFKLWGSMWVLWDGEWNICSSQGQRLG
jgi:hypothetical protein